MTRSTSETTRIMIVDDTPQNLQLLESMLRFQGYQVLAFPNGEMALRAASREAPDLILLDILMPGMDGYEVCTRLKLDPVLRSIPVIFLSALHEPWDKVRAFRSGGVDYITRPFQIEEVEARVRAHLQLCRLQQDLANQNARLESMVQERTRQLSEANERLSRLDHAKNEFLRVISHELRTPLNGLFGIAELLFMELPSNTETDTFKKHYEESQARILALIEDALLLTQIRVSTGEYDCQTSSLEEVLRCAVEKSRELARLFEVGIAPLESLPGGTVIGEPGLLGRALQALLETAIKFSLSRETVTLKVREGEGSRTLEIEAHGRTVPPAGIDRFFDVLAIGTTLTPAGDLGLRPAVADRLISAFGGTVSIENLTPPGIRFVVQIKAPVSPRQPLPTETTETK